MVASSRRRVMVPGRGKTGYDVTVHTVERNSMFKVKKNTEKHSGGCLTAHHVLRTD